MKREYNKKEVGDFIEGLMVNECKTFYLGGIGKYIVTRKE